MSTNKRRRFANWAAFFVTWIGIGVGGYHLLYHPKTPLPGHWNPVAPLDAMAPLTALTTWKLSRISGDRQACLAALSTISEFSSLPDKVASDQCHIRNRIQTRAVAGVAIRNTEMRCDLALRTAMWIHHGVQPAAERYFGQGVKGVRTQGVYNCRTIGGTTRMSLHAQAKAIDIAGFTLNNGRQIELSRDWQTPGPASDFLYRVRDSSCDWFRSTLSPDYNRAHYDHFHLQSQGWGACR